MSYNPTILGDLSRMEQSRVVLFYGTIVGSAYPNMYQTAKAQHSQIVDFMKRSDQTNHEIERSLENIRDSVVVYRGRINEINEDPNAEFQPNQTIAENTLGIRGNDQSRPERVAEVFAKFQKVVEDIESTIPELERMQSWACCRLM